MTQIAVLGAGAVGSLVGGLLAIHDPSAKVLLWARGAHGRRMQQRGTVIVKGPWGTREAKVTVCDDPAAFRGSDLALLTVKSQDTEATLRATREHLGAAPVVSLQNGINQHVLARFLAKEQFLVGMTATNMAIPAAGTVSLQRNGVTVIGSLAEPQPQERIDRIVKILRRSTLRFEANPNIEGIQYNKVAINTIGYTSVLSQSDFLRECILHPAWRRHVAKAMLDECFAVYRASGIQLESISGPSDARRFRRMLDRLDHPLLGPFWKLGIRAAARHRIIYSVEQDLLRGRPTEIEYVNGEIVRLGATCGVPAGLNARVVESVHQLEQQRPPHFFTQDQVIDMLGAS